MTAFTIGEAATQAFARMRPRRITGVPQRSGVRVPVRRDSLEVGTFETAFFAVPAKGEPDRLLRTARIALDAGKRAKRKARAEGRALSRAEAAVAGLTASAIRVFEELCALARLNAGRVFPSYDHLARATALGRATVARALGALETAGFLVKRRRFRRIEGGGPGPRYVQASNAYRPALPRHALPLLPRRLQAPPLPTDVVQRDADHASEQATMRATLSCRDLAHAVAHGALGRMLARLGAAIDRNERESQNGPESHSHSIGTDAGRVGAQREDETVANPILRSHAAPSIRLGVVPLGPSPAPVTRRNADGDRLHVDASSCRHV